MQYGDVLVVRYDNQLFISVPNSKKRRLLSRVVYVVSESSSAKSRSQAYNCKEENRHLPETR